MDSGFDATEALPDDTACPAVENLEAYCAGCGSPAQAAAISRHVQTCAACRARLAEAQAAEDLLGDVVRVLRDADGRVERGPPPAEAPAAGAPPRFVGRYRLIRPLGEGGMGVVYEAEQAHPQRRVALKMIRPGVSGEGALRRFEFEAEILGRLHHPGIAQIYEAGTTDLGLGPQPFFALELVTGRPLTEHADRAGWGLRQRVHALAQVCDAVQHAHQKGVIHRDLKPSNILVDEQGAPKVLDFGVARVTGDDVRPTAARTRAGQLIGTLPYMSPEQVSGGAEGVDTRSDVYALGVILFELLVRRLPHDLDQRTPADALRLICSADAPRLGASDRTLRGDLETIVAKALAKSPAERYPSAGALAEDLNRFLADRPVAARRQSRIYLLRKAIRRHRQWFAAAALALLALVAVAITATFAAAQRQTVIVTLKAQAQERETRLAAADARRAATSYYYQAVDLIRRGVGRTDALRLLNQAIAIDPTFAAARLERGLLRGVDEAYRMGTPSAQFRPDLAAALDDFDLAHDLTGGDWLVDPQTGRRLPPAEARALPADAHGWLMAFPGVRRLPDGSLVRVGDTGAELPVGGPGFPRALVSAGNLLAARLRQVPSGLWRDAIITELMDHYYDRASALDPADVYTRLSPALAAAAKPGSQDEAARLLAVLRDDPAAAGLVEVWQALAEIHLGGPRRSFPEVHTQRDPIAAEFAARRVTILAPGDAYGWYLLALARQEQGRYAEALETNRRAIAILDDNASADATDPLAPGPRAAQLAGPVLTNAASCLAQLGHATAAESAYARAWELSGRSALVLLERAEARHWVGQRAAAACDLQDAADAVLSPPWAPVPAIAVPVAWALLTFPDAELCDPATARRILTELRQRPTWADDPTAQMLLAYADTLCGAPVPEWARAPAAGSAATCPFRAAVCAAVSCARGAWPEAALWLDQAERQARGLPYPDPRLERLLTQIGRCVIDH